MLPTLKERAKQQTNFPLRVLESLYAGIYSVDQKWGFPRPLSVPSVRMQRLFAIILLCCQTGITFTGSLVRVTGSGLGCNTWPQCHPGSFVPVAGSAPWIHQIIEFGNRLLTFVLIIAAAMAFIAVVRAGRRAAILHLAFFQGIGIIVQAVIGGISVRMDLAWWTVAIHFLPSMLLVFLAARLVTRISEPDEGTITQLMPSALGYLTNMAALALAITLATGTMVTGAGPHAGDEKILPEHRLQINLDFMAQLHAHGMYLFLGLSVGLLAGIYALKLNRRITTTGYWLIGAIIAQGAIGIIQYWLGIPRWTVPLHVIGSGITTAIMGFMWSLKIRRI